MRSSLDEVISLESQWDNCLLQRDATVTYCHSQTQDLASFTKQADILIVAIGKRN